MRIHNNRIALPHGGTNLRFIDVYKQYFKALNNKPIFLLSFGMLLNCIGTFLINLHLHVYYCVYIVSKGFSKAQASYIILTVIGRLLTAFVANLNTSIDKWLYSGSLAVESVATIVYPHISNTLAGNIGYAVVFGLICGCCYVLITSVNMSFVDIKHLSAAIGVEFIFGGFGSVLGPDFAGKCTKVLFNLSMIMFIQI
jgi:Na+/melibiose symporter-like transporter